jgi:hypothetical protein
VKELEGKILMRKQLKFKVNMKLPMGTHIDELKLADSEDKDLVIEGNLLHISPRLRLLLYARLDEFSLVQYKREIEELDLTVYERKKCCPEGCLIIYKRNCAYKTHKLITNKSSRAGE